MKMIFALTVLCGGMLIAAASPPPPNVPPPGRADKSAEPVPRLTVRGEAQLDRPADQLRLSLGVTTQNAEASQAMQENSRLMNDVIAALEKVGLKKDEYQTGRFQVQPMYSHRPPRQTEGDWRPTIIGYQVINSIQIKTQKMELAGDLIEAATEAGANNIDSISFDLADPRKHRGEAIKEATANAVADARALAEASGQRLVRVLSLNLDHASMPIPMYDQMAAGRMVAEAAAAPPPITPGDVTVSASVTVVYEIAAMN